MEKFHMTIFGHPMSTTMIPLSLYNRKTILMYLETKQKI